jgi:hypothetical protein
VGPSGWADPEFDDHVLALDVSQLAETFPELVDPEFRRLTSPEKSDPVDLPRWLRLGGERRGEETASQGGEERASVHKEPPPDRPSGGTGALDGQAG